MTSVQEVYEACDKIRSFVYQTPLLQDHYLSQQLNSEVYFKLENQQVSGSFKARGAFNKILSYPKKTRAAAYFVAASTGNHAAAFCTVLKTLGLRGKVFLPESVSASKLEYIKSFGVPYELCGENSLQTEIYCRKVAEDNGYLLVHPYNDPLVVAGQGTIAAELVKQLPQMNTVIIPVGGGGLIGGVASFLKSEKPDVHIVGCQPLNSPEMVRSIEQGHILTEDITLPTLSDGTAGGMEQGSITFELARQHVDTWALITEEQITAEIRYMVEHHQMIIEGAAALSLAYLRQNAHLLSGQQIVLVICGKRISSETLKKVLGC